ncbi:site-specific DNA-methyltransferase [Sulfuricurvum sp.]|uniref:DNA-methyltransferase n=1 Tax=Sulfuricurvum sp. TaxID=2025608 RepID=UPI003562E4CF
MIEQKIIIGDFLDGGGIIKDNSVDLILTDPPYNISTEITIFRGSNPMKFKGTDIKGDFGEWDHFESEEKYIEFTEAWLDLCHKKLRPGGMFISYFDRERINSLSNYLKKKYKYKFKDYFAHLKNNPVPQARMVKWMSAWEMVCMLQKPEGKLTYNYKLGQQKNYAIVSITSQGERIVSAKGKTHPTQKPESIIELFIKYWSNEGDLILDPFCGTGTTLAMAKRLRRNAIGFEIDEDWKYPVEKRIQDTHESAEVYLQNDTLDEGELF